MSNNYDPELIKSFLKPKLEKIVEEYPVKHYGKVLESNGLKDFLNMAVPELPELHLTAKMYVTLNGLPSKCNYGNFPAFNTYTLGFHNFCTTGIECKCLAEYLSDTLSVQYYELTDEEKQRRIDKAKETCMARYGVSSASGLPETQAKRRKTCLEKYGADHQLKSKEYRQMYEAKMIEKCGFAFALCNPEIQEKSLKTTIERYGSCMTHARAALCVLFDGLNPFQIPAIMDKVRATMIAKTGVHNPSQRHYTPEQYELVHNVDLIISAFSGKTISQIEVETGLHRGNIRKLIKKHDLISIIDQSVDSSLEWKIKELLSAFSVEYEVGNRTILRPREIDFVTSDNKVGIEVGSLFWHSDSNAGRGYDYHYNKWKDSLDKGLTLYQWFDDDIEHKWDQIVHVLAKAHNMYEFTLHPDDCEMFTLDQSEGLEFVNANSFLTGEYEGSAFIGFKFDNDLKVVFEYVEENNSIYIVRVGEAPGNYYNLIYREFLAYMTAIHPDKEIIAYTDNCTNSGHEWKSAGMKRAAVDEIRCKYTENYHSRLDFIPNVEKVSEDEWENLKNAGYDRIWNAGQSVWIL